MDTNALPEQVRGRWIWLRQSGEKLERYIFFRKEFTLPETPASANVWITAQSLFHLYVNGRHMGFGPPPCPLGRAYVMSLDVGDLLEVGNNTLAVLVQNVSVARLGARRREGGLWLQLDVNGTPEVWTDSSWVCVEGEAFGTNRPRSSLSGGFTEKLDLRLFPEGWTQRSFPHPRWAAPDHVVQVSHFPVPLAPLPGPEWRPRRLAFAETTATGLWDEANSVSFVSFARVASEHGPGCYAAEGFVHSREDCEVPVEMYADDPCRVFVNEVCVKEQGVIPLPPRADLELFKPPCYRQAGVTEPEGTIHFQKGWNRVVVVQQVDVHSAGLTLVFPTLDSTAIRVVRKKVHGALPGWSIVGPLRTPISLVFGHLSFAHSEHTPYVPAAREPVDESAYLMACSFDPTYAAGGPVSETITLEEAEYIVVDMGRTVYGCPACTISGEDGDIVDIVTGEHYLAGEVLAYNEGRRNADALVLSSETHEWLATVPRGFRYLMVVARKVTGTVQLDDLGVHVREFNYRNSGHFESSEDDLNAIWETGRRTLQSTIQWHFLDAPAKDVTQYITDSMIQAWAAFHTFGAYDLSAKALREFAGIQFETGEIPAVCPSDLYMNVPDFALMWPIWLRRHIMYTGDREVLTDCLDAVQLLFEYYAELALLDRLVLGDLDRVCGAYCFLDHGDIDRRGIVTGVNAIYCRSLLSGAWLFEQAGHQERASELRHTAAAVARIIRNLTWDSDAGLFADSWHDGDMSSSHSWQTNILALYGGIALPEQQEQLVLQLFRSEAPFEAYDPGATNNPFFKYFVLMSAFELDLRELGIAILRHYWGAMLERGAVTWWELFDPDDDSVPTFSLCHGYGASPNAFLCTEVAGIRPASPGFESVVFCPLASVASWVRAVVPTPKGSISVEWQLTEDGEFEALVQADFPVDLIPVLDPEIAATATLHVSDEVTVLADEA